MLYFSDLQVVQGHANTTQPFQIQVDREPSWTWWNLLTATISMCCCMVLGVIATIIAVLSYVDHSTKQYERSKKKRCVAYGLAIAAIVTGLIAVIVTLIVFFAVFTSYSAHDYRYGY